MVANRPDRTAVRYVIACLLLAAPWATGCTVTLSVPLPDGPAYVMPLPLLADPLFKQVAVL